MAEEASASRADSEQPVVLVVDDEPDLLELVSLTLSRMNFRTRTAPDLNSARRLLKAELLGVGLAHDLRVRGVAAHEHGKRERRHADQPREHLHRRVRSFDEWSAETGRFAP